MSSTLAIGFSSFSTSYWRDGRTKNPGDDYVSALLCAWFWMLLSQRYFILPESYKAKDGEWDFCLFFVVRFRYSPPLFYIITFRLPSYVIFLESLGLLCFNHCKIEEEIDIPQTFVCSVKRTRASFLGFCLWCDCVWSLFSTTFLV